MDNLINIKLKIRKKNKSWLARQSGLDLSVISRVAAGKRKPNLLTAHKIASALNSFIEELFIF